MENLRILARLPQIVKGKPAPAQGRQGRQGRKAAGPFHFPSVAGGILCELFELKAEGIGMPEVGGKHIDSPRQHPSRHGLGVAWTGLEDRFPEPPGLDPVTALLGRHGEISQREVAVLHRKKPKTWPDPAPPIASWYRNAASPPALSSQKPTDPSQDGNPSAFGACLVLVGRFSETVRTLRLRLAGLWKGRYIRVT